ncbi:hypothetical protein LZG04_29970 [Saccharothrix sp. S26]|uniref:hypothetical protein n=1 Tax=Saccharothrix sp. S26 TaxID=2907215 RepID=UPI001F294079|nr:hypothetical protein [Saccharothrix sp. S26]MCE6998998.1 hypothetical protein [Saccharothrix sp. S26]
MVSRRRDAAVRLGLLTVAACLVTGLALLPFIPWGEVLSGLTAGATVGLIASVFAGVSRVERAAVADRAATALSTLRADRTLTFVRTFGMALVATALTLLPGLVGSRLTAVTVPAAIMVLGMALGFGNHHAWPAYLVATVKLARARVLPRDLLAFLDDVHRLGLLRAVGPVYQFRHAELHDHLLGRPPSPSGSGAISET